jgi:hypothetical protein
MVIPPATVTDTRGRHAGCKIAFVVIQVTNRMGAIVAFAIVTKCILGESGSTLGIESDPAQRWPFCPSSIFSVYHQLVEV